MPRLGVVTGTRVEAACFDRPADDRRSVLCSGLDPGRARDIARRLVAGGCTALASVGTAGGLENGLPAGIIIIADMVIAADGERLSSDPAWGGALLAKVQAAGLPVRSGTVAGRDAPLLGPQDKRRLHIATGALCCDMESHAVASIAHAAGVPFIALRVVADGVNDTLPRAALAAIGSEGDTRIGALLKALAAHPGELPEFVRLALASRTALRSLRRVAALGGPLLALP